MLAEVDERNMAAMDGATAVVDDDETEAGICGKVKENEIRNDRIETSSDMQLTNPAVSHWLATAPPLWWLGARAATKHSAAVVVVVAVADATAAVAVRAISNRRPNRHWRAA